MKGWIAALSVLIIGLGLTLLLFGPQVVKVNLQPASAASGSTSNTAATRTGSQPNAASAQKSYGEPLTNSLGVKPELPAPPRSDSSELPELPATPASSSLPPETVLENMRTTVRLYASTYGENPVGNNAEITSALQGKNARQLNFLKPEDGNRVNANGELVDTWGTPYFFHQLSGTEVEIRSAGPDRKMWTADDLIAH